MNHGTLFQTPDITKKKLQLRIVYSNYTWNHKNDGPPFFYCDNQTLINFKDAKSRTCTKDHWNLNWSDKMDDDITGWNHNW